MNLMRTSAFLILLALAAVALGVFISAIVPFALTTPPLAFICGLLAGSCFLLNLIGGIRAVALAPQTAGIVTPSLLLKLGREHGRLYTVAGIAGYLQVLFLGLALLLR